MMSDDQSAIYNSLRASTAAMLGYSEIDQLTAAQEIRLSRAISLRLIVDTAQAAQLCGRPIDVRTFTDASESLEKLCGGDPGALPSFDADASIAALEGTIDGILRVREQADHERDAERAWREEMAAVVAAGGNVDLTTEHNPASGIARHDECCPHPALVAPAAAVGGCEPAEPTPPPPPVLSDVEKMARANAVQPPANYLKGPDEPWRAWVDENGIRSSPWRRW
jgi:hypothetical protein